MRKRKSFFRAFFNRRGSSTVEYVLVIAAAVILASALILAVNNSKGVIKEKILAALKGEVLQIPPSAETGGKGNEPPKVEPSKENPPRVSENHPKSPVNLSHANPPSQKPDQSKSWSDKAKEIPIIGDVVEFVEPGAKSLYNNVLKPIGDYTGLSSIAGDVVEIFDPTPTIYELTTGKDWDTGEELSGFERYGMPVVEYVIAKKAEKIPGLAGKLLVKADKKFFDGKITKKLDELAQPVKEKRDEFVEWACSHGGLLSEKAVPTAYADNGGSGSKEPCLWQDILGGDGNKTSDKREKAGDKEEDKKDTGDSGTGLIPSSIDKLLKQDLENLRKKVRTNKHTIAVARTDVKGLENEVFEGASPSVIKEAPEEAGLKPLDKAHPERTIKAPFDNPVFTRHAEEYVMAEFEEAVKKAKLKPEEVEGTLYMLQSNPRGVCPACLSGINNPKANKGIFLKFSEMYPNLKIVVASEIEEGKRAVGKQFFVLKNGKFIE